MAEPKRHTDVLERVLESINPDAFAPSPQIRMLENVRKFRKFPPLYRPVTEDPQSLVRSYTKIVTRDYEKMVS